MLARPRLWRSGAPVLESGDDHEHPRAVRPLLGRTLKLALEYLDGLPQRPVAAVATLAELRQRLDGPLPAEGRDPQAVIEQLACAAADGLAASAGGRFYGWVIGGSVPAALAADWLTSTWDQNAGMFAVAPAAAVVEEVCGRWLLELLGLPHERELRAGDRLPDGARDLPRRGTQRGARETRLGRRAARACSALRRSVW